MRLLSMRYDDLLESTKHRIHELITELLTEGTSPSTEREHNRHRAWRILNILPPSSLSEEEDRAKNRLNRELGIPEHPLFLSWSSGFERVEAPASADALRSLFKRAVRDVFLM